MMGRERNNVAHAISPGFVAEGGSLMPFLFGGKMHREYRYSFAKLNCSLPHIVLEARHYGKSAPFQKNNRNEAQTAAPKSNPPQPSISNAYSGALSDIFQFCIWHFPDCKTELYHQIQIVYLPRVDGSGHSYARRSRPFAMRWHGEFYGIQIPVAMASDAANHAAKNNHSRASYRDHFDIAAPFGATLSAFHTAIQTAATSATPNVSASNRICLSVSGAEFIVVSSCVAYGERKLWRDHSVIRRRSHAKSADSSCRGRTELSEPLWGAFAGKYGAITPTPMWRRSAGVTRDQRGATCRGKYQSRQSFSRRSISSWCAASNRGPA